MVTQSGDKERSGQFIYKSPARVLLESLVRRGLIPPEETSALLEAARVTRRAVCLLLLDLGILDELALAETLVYTRNLPYIYLEGYTVDSDVLNLVPPGLCWERKVLPLDSVGSTLTLAMVDPLDDVTVTRVSAEHRVSVVRSVVIASELARAFDRHFPSYAKPAEAFGATEAAEALKAARGSLERGAQKKSSTGLPGWLSEGEEAVESAEAPATIPEEVADLPDWLDDEPDAPGVVGKASKRKPAKKRTRKRRGSKP